VTSNLILLGVGILLGLTVRPALGVRHDVVFLARLAAAALRHARGGKHARALSTPHLIWRSGQHVRYAPDQPAIAAPTVLKELTAA
jgi:hypothetical protein